MTEDTGAKGACQRVICEQEELLTATVDANERVRVQEGEGHEAETEFAL